jgi:carbonic anhydrase
MTHPPRPPRGSREALIWLEEGNREFAMLPPYERGTPGGGDARPFGIVLGCADSRVPIELVFGHGVDDLFIVRQAGNTAGADAIGSIDYAVRHIPTIRVVAVLGHTRCGAVAAAVESFLSPEGFLELAESPPLRSIVDRIQVSVRTAAIALVEEHGMAVVDGSGYRAALIDLATELNAAYVAYCVRAELPREAISRLAVVFCVYDVATGRISVTVPTPATFAPPPGSPDAFRALSRRLAGTPRIRALLQTGDRDSDRAHPT